MLTWSTHISRTNLHTLQKNDFCFQQDCPMSHCVNCNGSPRRVFGNHSISRNCGISYPSLSPDMIVCDYGLWRYLIHKIYARYPHIVSVVRTEISNITIQLLECAMDNFSSQNIRVLTCWSPGVRNFQNMNVIVILYKWQSRLRVQ